MSVSSVLEYVHRLDAALVEAVGGLLATYLHGSAALGGFVAGRSDVDVLVVGQDRPIGDDGLSSVAQAVQPAADVCPGRGLELSMVARRHAVEPGPPWPFLLHVNSCPGDEKIVFGKQRSGDPDLVMHYVACRTGGIAVRGPAPTELIGRVRRADILAHLQGELRWALEHANEAYGVLNACRALAYLHDDEVLSKVDGARYALGHGGPQELITGALAMQRGERPDRPPSKAARRFITEVGHRFEGRRR